MADSLSSEDQARTTTLDRAKKHVLDEVAVVIYQQASDDSLSMDR